MNTTVMNDRPDAKNAFYLPLSCSNKDYGKIMQPDFTRPVSSLPNSSYRLV
jgi:hypothetical protein